MIKVKEIANLVNGTVCGDGELVIGRLTDISSAVEGDLTFAINHGQLEAAKKSEATCVLTALNAEDFPKTLLTVKDIKSALTILYDAMVKMAPTLGIYCALIRNSKGEGAGDWPNQSLGPLWSRLSSSTRAMVLSSLSRSAGDVEGVGETGISLHGRQITHRIRGPGFTHCCSEARLRD